MVDFYRATLCKAQYMLTSCVCPSVCVCVSVTIRYCIKTAKRRIMQIMPHDRSGISESRGPSAIVELLVNFGCPIHISGMAEARAVNFFYKGRLY